MKKFRTITAIGLALTMLMGSVTAFAEENVGAADLPEGVTIEKIDPYIYKMIDDYKNGTFIERDEDNCIDARDLFSENDVSLDDDSNVEYIYDLHKIDDNTYEATQVALYNSSKNDTDTVRDVTATFTIVYEKKDFGDYWDYIMLTRLKGGIVKEGKFECTELMMKYNVSGDAYDANGNRKGLKGKSTRFSDYTINNPVVGNAVYSMPGPSDYYYNMGATGTLVAGYFVANIENSSGTTDSIPLSIEMEGM